MNREIQKIVDLVIEKVYSRTNLRIKDVPYSSLITLDGQIDLEYKIGLVTGNCSINVINSSSGDTGVIEVIMDSTGGHTVTLGSTFGKCIGGEIDTSASADNFIWWMNFGGAIVYSITTVIT